MAITIDPEKKDRINKLIKSFKELDACIQPFQEQRKELRTSYLEEGWLTKEEFDLVKKSFNLLKKKTDMDDLSAIFEIAAKEMGGE